ncbi:MAG: hypothetical protein ACRC6T_01400 [Sarcina sp.]
MFTKLKNLTKKKKILLALLILLITGLLFINNAINGNPISKSLFKNKVQSYIDTTYPNTDFTIKSTIYNFKDLNYTCTITSKSRGLEFMITQYNTSYFYDQYKEAEDGRLIANNLTTTFSNTLENEFKAVINNDKFDIFPQIIVFQEKYKDQNVQYDKSFDDEFTINISTHYDQTYTQDEVVEVMTKLKNHLAQNKHNGFKGMYINFDENGISKSILITNDNLTMTDEDVKKSVKDISISSGIHSSGEILFTEFENTTEKEPKIDISK